MDDPRLNQLADILARHSTAITDGDRVLISMTEPDTFPLVRAVYREAVCLGAIPYVEFQSALLERDLMQFGTLQQIESVPEMQTAAIDWADVYINLRGCRNPYELANIDDAAFLARRKAMGGVAALRTERTRWVIVRVPNEAFAQQAGMSLDEAIEIFFSATLLDWSAEAEHYETYRSLFQSAEAVRIVGRDTDLTFSTRGRIYVIDDGHINMPGGEIYTAPVDDSAEGIISFEFPGVYFGQKIEGIRLEFAGGAVVKASAERNEDLLRRLIAMDEGAQRIGEFGVGINTHIQRFCADLFYDEKIGGTVHIALGRAYAACGGTNRSDLHWDIVKDLRDSGSIYLDGHVVFEQGKFLV